MLKKLNRIKVAEAVKNIFSLVFSIKRIKKTEPLIKRIDTKTSPRVSGISKYDLTINTIPTKKRIVAETNLSLFPSFNDK